MRPWSFAEIEVWSFCNMDKKRIMHIAVTAASALFLAFAVFTVLRFIISLGWADYHSDCADTMLWAKAGIDAGQIVSSDYKYAALLPFGGNLLFEPFVRAYGLSMNAQIMAMCLFLCLFTMAMVFFFRSFGYRLHVAFAGTAVFLLSMCASKKLREIWWQHILYYSLGIIFFLLIATAINHAIRALKKTGGYKKPLTWVPVGLGVLATFFAAANGMQIILLSVFPVMAALIGGIYLDGRSFVTKKNAPEYICMGAVSLATVFGIIALIVVSHGVSAGYQTAYSRYSDMKEWTDNLLKFPNQWFSLLGIEVKGTEDLISGVSILIMIKLAFAIMLLIMPLVLLIRYKKLESDNLKYMTVAHFAMSAFVIFGYIFGKLSAANWRLIPVYSTALITCFMYIVERLKKLPRLAVPAGLVVLTFSIIGSACVYSLKADDLEKNENYKLAQFLTEKGLTKGYATFWHSAVVTVFSNGQTHVVSVNVDDKGVEPYYYQNEYAWFEDVPGQENYFLMLSKSEDSKVMTSGWAQIVMKAKEVYEQGGFYIYVFDKNLPFNDKK